MTSTGSPFEQDLPNVQMTFLPAIIGPFNSVHKKLLRVARDQKKTEIVHHPLSCFEAIISLSIDDVLLIDYTSTPCDFRPSISPYHQVMVFNSNITIPAHLFSSSQFVMKVTLTHRIASHKSTIVASGSQRHIVGKQIFPLYGELAQNKAAGIIMCDIMRLLTPSLSHPLFSRVPSPAPSDVQPSVSTDSLYLDQIVTDVALLPNDLYHASGSIVDTFAALLTGPDHEIAEPVCPLDVRDTRLFKAEYMPKKTEIPAFKQLINRPFIAGFEIQKIMQYKVFSSTFPSGILKLASIEDFDLTEDPPNMLPIPFALFILNSNKFPKIRIKTKIVAYAKKSLQSISDKEACRFVSMIVQSSRNSPSIEDFMFERARKCPEFAILIYWTLKEEFENSSSQNFKVIFDDWKNEKSTYFQEAEDAAVELEKLRKVVDGVKSVSGRDAKHNYVKTELEKVRFNKPFRLPLCPSFIVQSVSTENIIVFGSSLQPVKMDFLDKNGNVYSAILKVGDDMRQDALAVTAIQFIDDNLKRFNIDMCLTHYAVLPITRSFGLMQFVVGAKAISKVLQITNNLIQNFFDGCKTTTETAKDSSKSISPTSTLATNTISSTTTSNTNSTANFAPNINSPTNTNSTTGTNSPVNTNTKTNTNETNKKMNLSSESTPTKASVTTSPIVTSASAMNPAMANVNKEDEKMTKKNEEERLKKIEEEMNRERFIKSAAAYTVISYVLGVGDRHLDNLLMKSNGDFFHVDYGFMFGKDPKPLPCSVRVVGEMVTAFDHIDTKSGSTTPQNQKGYYTFLRHCAVVFNAIRRKADEFCCLIALMSTAELPHLPTKDDQISQILMDRLHLELTEKDAGKKIISEIEKSVKALLPKFYEWLHQKRNTFA